MVSPVGKFRWFAIVGPTTLGWLLGVTMKLSPCIAAEPVSIRLNDGRPVQGQVDRQTDQHRLWLRREDEGVEVASGFPWNEVARVVVGQQSYTAAEFRARAREMASSGRKFLDLRTSAEPLRETPSIDDANAWRHRVGPIRTLVIEAQLAQWDDDAQTDGLRVIVAPLDAQGQLVAIDGQIDLTLVAQVEWTKGGHHGPLVPKFRELERVSRIVRRDHFANGLAAYDLPFSQAHPDVDLGLATKALVHARLSVPGNGVFEASDANVSLREYSRFRDQLQYYTPRRYLPLESGGTGHR